MKNKLLIAFVLIIFLDLKSSILNETLSWLPILTLPALTLLAIEKTLPVTYDDMSNQAIHDRLAFFPATLFLSACDRIIDKNPNYDKYFIDLVRNGSSLLLCNILYAYQHGERSSRVIYPFEPYLGIMPDVTSGQLARYISVFKMVNYIFKNILKVNVESTHI